MSFLPGHFPAGAVARAAIGSGPTLSGAYLTTGQNNTTFFIGAEPAAGERRFIVVVATDVGPTSITSPTIGGGAATTVIQAVDLTSANSFAGIFYREIPTGTTANINASYNAGSVGTAQVHVYRLIVTGGGGIAVTDTATDISDGISHTLDLNTAAGGFAIAGASNINGGPHSWSGLTEDDDRDLASDDYISSASAATTTETPRAISVTRASSTAGSVSVAASFEIA